MSVTPHQPGVTPDRGPRDLSAGLGDAQAQGRGPRGQHPPDAARAALFEGALAAVAPLRRLGDDDRPDDPDALPIGVPLVPLAHVPAGEVPRTPDLPAPRAAELAALAEKLGGEIRAAVTAVPSLRTEGFSLRLDLGASVLGVQSMTLHFGPGTLTLALSLGPGGGVHDLPLAVQALAAALAHRHPGRTIRIMDEERTAEGTAQGEPVFDPLTPTKARST